MRCECRTGLRGGDPRPPAAHHVCPCFGSSFRYNHLVPQADVFGSILAEWPWRGKKTDSVATFTSLSPQSLTKAARATLRSREHVTKCWHAVMLSVSGERWSPSLCNQLGAGITRNFTDRAEYKRRNTSRFPFFPRCVFRMRLRGQAEFFFGSKVYGTLSVFCNSNLLRVPNWAGWLPIHLERFRCNSRWRQDVDGPYCTTFSTFQSLSE